MESIKKIKVGGVEYDIHGVEMTKVTHAELVSLRDGGLLEPGHVYRITDYRFTCDVTYNAGISDAGHVFDVLVMATGAGELSHLAGAALHDGDEYFAGCSLGAWQLWYDLDNDNGKYAWADALNGRGVIYRMIDDRGNDCGYDFKNCLMSRAALIPDGYVASDERYYTFSSGVGGVASDYSVIAARLYCDGNVVRELFEYERRKIGKNVFVSCGTGYTFSSNVVGGYENVLVGGVTNTTVCDGCRINQIFGSWHTLGISCENNVIHGTNNTLGVYCSSCSIGKNSTFNVLGRYCFYCHIKENCGYNKIGNQCGGCYINNMCKNCVIEDYGVGCTISSDSSCCEIPAYSSYRNVGGQHVRVSRGDDYVDDGSGKLVPVKHPDLSTQASVLPYKFGGQYVYEKLLYLGEEEYFDGMDKVIELSEFAPNANNREGVNTIILKAEAFVYGTSTYSMFGKEKVQGIVGLPAPVACIVRYLSDNPNAVVLSVTPTLDYYQGLKDVKVYVRLVWTSAPAGGGGYGYGY